MSPREGGTFIISNGKAHSSAIDLSGTDNTSVSGWERHGGDNQKWRLERNNNQWTFRNVGNGRFLGLAQGHIQDDARLAGVDEEVTWDIFPDEQDGSFFRIFVPGTDFNVDLSDHGNSANGTPVTLWGKWAGRNQVWRFEEA